MLRARNRRPRSFEERPDLLLPEATPAGEPLWLEPYSDQLLDDLKGAKDSETFRRLWRPFARDRRGRRRLGRSVQDNTRLLPVPTTSARALGLGSGDRFEGFQGGSGSLKEGIYWDENQPNCRESPLPSPITGSHSSGPQPPW